jgi:hypothetical protein
MQVRFVYFSCDLFDRKGLSALCGEVRRRQEIRLTLRSPSTRLTWRGRAVWSKALDERRKTP